MILALRDQVAPPTLNLDNGDAASQGVDIVAREARRMPMEYAISTDSASEASTRAPSLAMRDSSTAWKRFKEIADTGSTRSTALFRIVEDRSLAYKIVQMAERVSVNPC
jgi:hypothetical protein